jgi:hypothetical protein
VEWDARMEFLLDRMEHTERGVALVLQEKRDILKERDAVGVYPQCLDSQWCPSRC